MCTPAVGAVLQIGGQVAGQYAAVQQAVAQGEAMKLQAEQAVKSMNYGFRNYEIERQDAFDQSVMEITKVRQNAIGLNAGVDAAINEDYEGGGRTADLLKRSVRGDEARTVDSIQANYDRKSNEIDLNKETLLMNTKDTLKGMKPPKMPSQVGMYIGVASAGINGYNATQNAETNAFKENKKYNWLTGTY